MERKSSQQNWELLGLNSQYLEWWKKISEALNLVIVILVIRLNKIEAQFLMIWSYFVDKKTERLYLIIDKERSSQQVPNVSSVTFCSIVFFLQQK